ncbi:uncharacterized protein TNCV_1655361 [Trichonephila clavipes]|nr:uncharacterized protein TNCV_1655361 [Trichonephila clavipes]
MGDLPVLRLIAGIVFFKSGAYFATPFQAKPRKGRDVRALKTYAFIFECFITKAVYLELIEDLTANSFIAVLRHFIARRGRPEELYSDCGTNFLLVLLNKRDYNKVINYLSNEGVTWKYNLPSFPHFLDCGKHL